MERQEIADAAACAIDVKKTRAAAAAADIGLKEDFNYANKMNAPEGFCSRAVSAGLFSLTFYSVFFFFVAFHHSNNIQIDK